VARSGRQFGIAEVDGLEEDCAGAASGTSMQRLSATLSLARLVGSHYNERDR